MTGRHAQLKSPPRITARRAVALAATVPAIATLTFAGVAAHADDITDSGPVAVVSDEEADVVDEATPETPDVATVEIEISTPSGSEAAPASTDTSRQVSLADGDPDSVDPDPIDPDPVDPDPVDPDPVDPEPVDPEPIDPDPVDPQPETPTPSPQPSVPTPVEVPVESSPQAEQPVVPVADVAPVAESVAEPVPATVTVATAPTALAYTGASDLSGLALAGSLTMLAGGGLVVRNLRTKGKHA